MGGRDGGSAGLARTSRADQPAEFLDDGVPEGLALEDSRTQLGLSQHQGRELVLDWCHPACGGPRDTFITEVCRPAPWGVPAMCSLSGVSQSGGGGVPGVLIAPRDWKVKGRRTGYPAT